MPKECVEILASPAMDIDIDAMNEGERAEEEARAATSSAPRTPKRDADREDHHATPMKQPKDPRRDDEEPSNRDLLTFLQQMKISQEDALRSVQERLGQAENRMTSLEKSTATRLDLIESKVDNMELIDGADTSARDRNTRLEATVAEQMAAVSKKLEGYA